MKLRIKHVTEYNYSKEVTLFPHHLYFYPAHRNYLELVAFDLSVQPQSGLSFRLDAENNAFHQCWFNQPITQLKTVAEMVVTTHYINPFDFIIETGKNPQPTILSPYLEKQPLTEEIINWLKNVTAPAGDNMVTLLTFLNQEMHMSWEHTIRYEPTILSITECFNSKKGSCRDISWLMVQLLRNINIPARFVSGYAFNPGLAKGHELHAWVEAFLPGAGWIGLDPSAGLLATDHYIPVVSSYQPQNTFPIQGLYSGDASSELSFEVSIEQLA